MDTHNNQHKIEHAPPTLKPFWFVCLVSGDDLLLHEMRRTQNNEAFVLQVLRYSVSGGCFTGVSPKFVDSPCENVCTSYE